MIARLLSTIRISTIAIVCWLAAGSPLHAQPAARALQTLQVISFDGGWNLPIWAAQRQGFFEANGLAVQLTYTPNSAALITGLFDGKYQIAMASIDNVVAYDEGQGEATVPDSADLFAFLVGDSGLLSVVGGKDIKSVGDLKGKTLSVDAMTNGLAFVLRELVARGGVRESDVNYVRAGGTVNRYR